VNCNNDDNHEMIRIEVSFDLPRCFLERYRT